MQSGGLTRRGLFTIYGLARGVGGRLLLSRKPLKREATKAVAPTTRTTTISPATAFKTAMMVSATTKTASPKTNRQKNGHGTMSAAAAPAATATQDVIESTAVHPRRGGCQAATGDPQRGQNFAASGSAVLHRGHRISSPAEGSSSPQTRQNFEFPSFLAPHFTQKIGTTGGAGGLALPGWFWS